MLTTRLIAILIGYSSVTPLQYLLVSLHVRVVTRRICRSIVPSVEKSWSCGMDVVTFGTRRVVLS
ncbi:hypothetical protein EJ05DRAFT_472737 [Pseudovirgaria hyperparasitica]|uniref:Uncharacterized protein n=1 Tax=Pseudovirgaria hyperparasitica TaxID=470096 RepID=A0A6A6WG15_9PEZI|nr:uncharacterized protein EJ05DRAFT_472737 [Pseudovirgaria hyperparasitica]KAF2761772.1 hypothetical protein EJ05DRAFT_472737 [Pseudovirgaria hyperparasitica]